jgi:predicted DNA-binding transcriptional regulator AlpA
MKSIGSPEAPVFLRAGLVRSRYGGIGAATLWRWIKARKFPAPRYLPGGQRVCALSDLEAWEREHLQAHDEAQR